MQEMKIFFLISVQIKVPFKIPVLMQMEIPVGGGALGYFLGGYVLPGPTNWHPILKKISLKLIARSRNRPIFYTPF